MASMGMKTLFDTFEPLRVIAKMECKVVTGFDVKMVEAFNHLKDGIPSVDISKLMPAALEHFQHVQYLDLLQSMTSEDSDDSMCSCSLDHHVKVNLLWRNG